MCYSYRDREADKEEARKMMQEKEDRRRREGRTGDPARKPAPEKERELVRA